MILTLGGLDPDVFLRKNQDDGSGESEKIRMMAAGEREKIRMTAAGRA
jgi:hypothetical protein